MPDVSNAYLARLIQNGFAEIRQDLRMLRAAVNDIARENVTQGEIAELHNDVNLAMGKADDIVARIEVIERKLEEVTRP